MPIFVRVARLAFLLLLSASACAFAHVRVTEPTGATSLYAYRYGSPFMPTNYPASDMPTNTPLGTLDDGSGATNILSAVLKQMLDNGTITRAQYNRFIKGKD